MNRHQAIHSFLNFCLGFLAACGNDGTGEASTGDDGASTTGSGNACVPFLTDKPDGETACDLPCDVTLEFGTRWYCTTSCPSGGSCPADHTCFEQLGGSSTCLLPCTACPGPESCQSDCPATMRCVIQNDGGSACRPG